MRKILLLIILAVLAGGIGYGLFRIFRSAPEGEPLPPSPPAPPAAATPSSALMKVTDRPMFGYWIQRSSGDIFAVDREGKIARFSPKGEKKSLSETPIPLLSAVIASPEGDRALIARGYPFTTSVLLFDVASNTLEALPDGTVAGAFSPDGSRLAFLKERPDVSELHLLRLKERVTELTATLHQKDLFLAWATSTRIYLLERSSAFTKSGVWEVNLADKTVRQIIPQERGLTALWSEDGASGLLFNNERGNDLRVIDGEGTAVLRAPFLTLPQKCVLRAKTAYCAVPDSIPPQAVLPDDYFQKAFYLKDKFLTWSFASATSTPKFIDPGTTLDAEHLSLNPGGTTLFFINRYDNNIYSLRLAP